MKKTVLFIFLSIMFLTTNAQYDFGSYNEIDASSFNAPQRTVCFDVNEDGLTDIVAGNYYSPSFLAWFMNNGDGTFSSEKLISDQSSVSDLVKADFNADGHIDIASTNRYNDQVAWYANNGAGIFTPHIITSSADGAQSLAVADIDGDGDIDMVVLARNSGYIYLFTNNGSGEFTSEIIDDLDANFLVSVKIADINGNDDHLDFIIGTEDGVYAYMNAGNESFSQSVIDDELSNVTGLSIGDIDGDNVDDLAVSCSGNNAIYWYENNSSFPSVSFNKNTLVSSYSYASAVEIGDINLDGNNDIVGSAGWEDNVSYWLNDGTGTFGSENVIFDTVNYVRNITIADLAGDSKPEVITASLNDDRIMYFDNNSWNEHYITHTLASVDQVVSFDINQDGNQDIIVNSYDDYKLSYYLNNGNASFSEQIILSLNKYYAHSLTNGDLNNDGFQDIVIGGYYNSRLVYFLGNGTDFDNEILIDDNARYLMRPDIADFNNDGQLDIIGALRYRDQIVLYVNDSLNFLKDTVTLLSQSPMFVKAVDLNNDGKQDFITYGEDDHRLVYFLNISYDSTSVQFSDTASLIDDSYAGVGTVACKDLDGNGYQDIVVTVPNDNLILAYRNQGNLVFDIDTLYYVSGTYPQTIKLEDITDDGDYDMIVTYYNDYSQNAVRIFENRGNGTFNSPVNISSPYYPDHQKALIIKDLDNDGDKEIITGATWRNSVGFYENYALYIVKHPEDVRACEGDTVKISIDAYGVEHYQWYKDGEPLSENTVYRDVNSYELTICNVDVSLDSSVYYCEINNDIANQESHSAVLRVDAFIQAEAGDNSSVCQDSYTLNGNEPMQGTGQWTLLQGTAFFNDQNVYNAQIINLSVDTLVLTWKITNGLCLSSDTVELYVDSLVEAVAVDDFYLCETDSALLSAQHIDSVYNGTWSIIDGVADIDDINADTTWVRNIARQDSVVIEWRVTNGVCVSTDIVKIKNDTTIYAYAMSDTTLCVDTVILIANDPQAGVGQWSLAGGNGYIHNIYKDTTLVTDLSSGNNTFVWQIQNGACISSDYVNINVYNTINITASPEDITVNEGEIAYFSIETEGTPSSYQWYKNDELISDDGVHYYGTNSATLIIANVELADTGAYHCLVASEGCNQVASQEAILTVIPANAISEVDIDVNIFPNPASGSLNVVCSENILEIEFVNITGQLSKKVFVNSEKISVDISNLQAGVYFVKINTSNNTVIRKLVVH